MERYTGIYGRKSNPKFLPSTIIYAHPKRNFPYTHKNSKKYLTDFLRFVILIA